MECIIMSEDEVIEKFSDLVHIIATAKTVQPSDADDVYQEVFFRYIRKPPKFKSEAHAEAWFVTTTVNIIKDMRKSIIISNREYPLTECDSNALISDNDFVSEIEQQTDFEHNLSLLNPTYKAVLYLHFDCGYTYKEIGDILDENEGNIKAIAMRAKRQYRRLILDGEEVTANA